MGFIKRIYETSRDVVARLMKYQKETDLLKSRLDMMINVPQWQAGFETWSDGTPKTFCNLAAWYLLDDTLPTTKYGPYIPAYHKNITPMLRSQNPWNITITPLDVAVANIIAHELKLVDPEDAQILANKGVPVMGICAHPSHVVIARPDSDTYNPVRGPLISQCGIKCGTYYTNDPWCFGSNWASLKLYWVVFDERK